MYKSQMVIQKIACLVFLVACALIFIYSLGYMTDAYNVLRPGYTVEYDELAFEGAYLYYEMQPFNSSLTIFSLLLVVIAVFLFITSTQKRRKYYISNYVVIVLSVAAIIALYFWATPQIAGYRERFVNETDFEQMKFWNEVLPAMYGYSESTFWYDAGFYVFYFGLGAAGFLVINLLLKIIVMKKERHVLHKYNKEATA